MPDTTVLSAEHEHLTGLRVNDLVAKTARVTLKDTTRVLKSALVVADFLNMDLRELLDTDFSVERPSQEQAALCNEAFDDMRASLFHNGGTTTVECIRAID